MTERLVTIELENKQLANAWVKDGWQATHSDYIDPEWCFTRDGIAPGICGQLLLRVDLAKVAVGDRVLCRPAPQTVDKRTLLAPTTGRLYIATIDV
jgi:hypothetical protein